MEKILNDVPDILYKYRDWGNDNHKRLLTHRELYFASVDQFNDPFDGTIPHRYNPDELTEENIFLKYLQMTKREHPDWDDTRIHQECYEYQHRGYFHDERYLEDFEEFAFDSLNGHFGVVCLCKEPDNLLLWSHYSNSHTGICIGFDKFGLWEDTKCQFAHMQYQEEFPLLGLFDDVFIHFRKLIGTKSKDWEYEMEYRLTKSESPRTLIKLRKETIVEVRMGCKMEQRKKDNMIQFMLEEYPHARLYDMNLAKGAFRIEQMQIL